MAKIPQGILGGIRGRVGSVVGGAWRGINYIRSMPLSVANPNTTAQQAQRGAFASCVLVARLLLATLIATFWDPFARYMSGYNHFISINIDAFTTAGLTIPADFHASRGILTPVDSCTAVGSGATDECTITWTDNSGSGDALATDLAAAVIYDETKDAWKYFPPDTEKREDETMTRTFGQLAENNVCHVWLFFTRPDIEKISDDVYDDFICGA